MELAPQMGNCDAHGKQTHSKKDLHNILWYKDKLSEMLDRLPLQ